MVGSYPNTPTSSSSIPLVQLLQHLGPVLLSILLQSLQPLEQSIAKGFSVTGTQLV